MTDRLLGVGRDLSKCSNLSKKPTSCAQSCSKEQGLEKMQAVKKEKAYLTLVRKSKAKMGEGAASTQSHEALSPHSVEAGHKAALEFFYSQKVHVYN